MRLRWPRLLPGFPAALLVPAFLAGWAIQCSIPIVVWTRGAERIVSFQGEPFPFMVRAQFADLVGSEFRVSAFFMDLALALAAAYLIAMAADRLLFPAIRAARGKKLGQGEVG